MDNALWSSIQEFELDNLNDEYGFSTRLSIENNWTIYFTQAAITEYKKFMFMAATSIEMVSPSHIVDIVWHQHLIFTNSYADLCKVLNKKIEHIPSTHNKSEKEKFESAKTHTKELYEKSFGKQPSEIWDFNSQTDSINLTKTNINSSNLNRNFWIVLALLTIPFYYLIKLVIIKIQNPNFLYYYIASFAGVIVLLELYTKSASARLVKRIKSNAILSNLTAFELVFIQKGRLTFVIHGVINNLITQNKIEVLKNKKLNLINEDLTENQYENCIINIMREYEPMPYHQLTNYAIKKPIFEQIQKGCTEIKQHISQSKEYLLLILVPYIILGIALLFGYSRLLSGMMRDKPTTYILMCCFAFTLITVFFLFKIRLCLFTASLPNLYKKELLDSKSREDWEWNYFIFGKATLVSSFIPLINHMNNNKANSGFGASCGASCGSSCGSSCGGGGGCGGCGGH